MDPVLLGGLLGIGGTLAGVVVPLGWQDWRERQARSRRVRYVARALSDELLWVEAGLARVTGKQSLRDFDRDAAALHALWLRHEAAIESLDPKAWALCRTAMRTVERVAIIAEGRGDTPPMTTDEYTMVTLAAASVIGARRALNEVGGLKPPEMRTWEDGVGRAKELADKARQDP